MRWWVVAAAGVIVAIATALRWWLPKWQVGLRRLESPDAKARADVEDNFRKTIGQLLGGAVVLVGAGFAYYQTQLTLQASHDQIKASHDQIISQQVSRCLRRCAHSCATAPKPIQTRGPATDIQAAITVIGRRAETLS